MMENAEVVHVPASAGKSWLKQPGECHDSNGVPIYPGDLLRTFHFTGPRRRKWYLYHVAVYDTQVGAMRMMPVEYLEPSVKREGGNPATPVGRVGVGVDRGEERVMRVGDVVVPTFESQQRGHVLACGCGLYTHAIVGSVNPFVLVSEAGDMVWSCIWTPDDVTCLCQAHPEIVRRVLERLERTGEHRREKAAEAAGG
jgi:hypothetical protein